MDGIAKLLADIASAVNAGKDLDKVIDDIGKSQSEAFKSDNPVKYYQTLTKLKAELGEVKKAEKEYAKVHKEAAKQLQENNKISEETQKKLERLEAVQKKASSTLVTSLKNQTRALNDKVAAQLRSKEIAKEHWRQNTLMGRSYSALTGSLGKLTAGLTASTMAYKALNNWTEAARLKQDLLIKSFRSFDGTRSYDNYSKVASSVMDTDEALRSARASAIRFGQDVNAVGGYMTKFQKIAGTDNVKALGALTEATMAAARMNGIEMADAMQFVQNRIDKFGGSASSAILAMGNMRDVADKVNDAFGDTIIRADDVINAVNDIASSSNVYAIDQDFVTKAISKNIVTLRSQGESYDFAKDKAIKYVKAVTSEAPEFMQIKAGQKLKGIFQESINAGDFMDKYGKELDKAKPGLSKKVQDVLGDGTIDAFTKGQLIQQMTGETEVGINVMNDQLVELAGKGSQGIQIIKQLYNTDEQGAKALIDQAKARQEEQQKLIKLQTATYEEGLKLLGIHDKDGKKVKGSIALSREQFALAQQSKENMRSTFDISQRHLMVEQEKTKRMNESKAAAQGIEEAQKKIAQLKTDQENAQDDVTKEIIAERIKEQEKLVADSAKKLKGEDLERLEAYTKKVTERLQATNDVSGTSFKAMLEEYSNITNVALIGGLFLFKGRFKKVLDGFLDRFQRITNSSDMGGSDGGSFGGKGGKLARKASMGKKFGRSGTLLRKGLGRFGRGKFGKTVQKLGNAFGGKALDLGGSILSKGSGLLKGGGGLLKGAGKGLFKGASKIGSKMLGPLAGLADFGINMLSGEGLGRSAIKAVGSTIGGALGGIGGSLVAPGVGTIAGGAGGAMAGDWLGGKVADMFGFEDPEAISKGTNKDMASQLRKTTAVGQGASSAGSMMSPGSGVLRPSAQVMQDKLMLELDGGILMQIMGALQNKSVN